MISYRVRCCSSRPCTGLSGFTRRCLATRPRRLRHVGFRRHGRSNGRRKVVAHETDRRLLAREGVPHHRIALVRDGQIVKLLANGLWITHALVASEALLIGQGLGLDPEALRGILQETAGGSRFLDNHADQLLDGNYLPSFGLDRVVEELDTVDTPRNITGVDAPILNASRAHHHAALDRFGPILGELLGVRLLEDRAGREL